MSQLNLTKRLFWIIAFFIIAAQSIVVVYLYHKSEELVQKRAYSKSKTLQDYFVSMRYIYHQQFLASGIDLSDATIGFLPAHASSYISEEFSKRSTDGITIRNVSERPRNLMNKADKLEEEMIEYFNKNPQENEKMKLLSDGQKEFYFFSAPLRIEPYCLSCHGKKEEVLPYIARRYTTAYDYKIGDVRGLTSIRIPKNVLFDPVMELFYKEVIFSIGVMSFLLILMYFTIKEQTKRDVEQKKELEKLVNERTKGLVEKSVELEAAYAHQKHLYSILRTVADSNQILITTKTLEELLHETALCLFNNDSFACVKITLFEKGTLHVKESQGCDNLQNTNAMEEYVFKHNTSLIVTPSSNNLPFTCNDIIEPYGITEAYATALTSDKFSKYPLGTLSIATTLEGGFSPEEREMIEELAGDIGFAVNSFLQKESIVKLSYYDALTGLPNKTMLSEHLKIALQSCKNTHTKGALLFLDLDNFKSINDLKGHSSGDALLIEMALRLEHYILNQGLVSRFGGDQFAILLPNLGLHIHEAALSAEEIALKILQVSKEPFLIDGHLFYLSASIGITLLSEDESCDVLMSRADSAMYLAKSAGKDTIRFFDENIQKIMEEKSLMLQELRDAIEGKEFELYYQVQVNTQADIVGVEALIRWIHPTRGMVSPAAFIPLCEEIGLIVPLGQWVLEQAVRQVSLWQEDHQKSQWRISVNVSTRQFEQENFVTLVTNIIQRANINPSLIRLELTESLLIGDTKSALEKITELKTFGISLSVDDFGTGYSSLQYLKELSVNELKIDQSFIHDFLHQKSDALIVEAIISIGTKFNMEVIAEGVETKEQFEMLKAMGCQNFQGYYFGKPLPPQEL